MQFSIRALLILTTAVAGLAWTLFAPPQWVGLWALYFVYLMLPAAVLTGIIYHRGAWQAFFIGCAPGTLLVAYFTWIVLATQFTGFSLFSLDLSASADELIMQKLYAAVPLAATIASGFTG